MKNVILIGGGKSVLEGVKLGLWNKIKGKEIWSINYAFMTMPYLPSREVFVDRCFYKNNVDALQALSEQKVPLYARHQDTYAAIDEIKKFQTTRETTGYKGKETFKTDGTPHLFVGQLGLSGTFALALAIAEEYTTIYLLGYDFGVVDFNDKHTHYYQKDIKVVSTGAGNPQIYINQDNSVKDSVRDFEIFSNEQNIKIYNVSTQSRIPYFEKIDYSTFFHFIEIGDKYV